MTKDLYVATGSEESITRGNQVDMMDLIDSKLSVRYVLRRVANITCYTWDKKVKFEAQRAWVLDQYHVTDEGDSRFIQTLVYATKKKVDLEITGIIRSIWAKQKN